MKVGIVGLTETGKKLSEMIKTIVVVHDPEAGFKNRAEINKECEIAFICYKEPEKIKEALLWLSTPVIVIYAPVVPGITERLLNESESNGVPRRIVFQYINGNKIILGGDRGAAKVLMMFWQNYISNLRFFLLEPTMAEIVQHIENYFSLVQIAFFGQAYNMCEKLGVEYNELKEAVSLNLDTTVYPERLGSMTRSMADSIGAITELDVRDKIDFSLMQECIEILKRIKYNKVDYNETYRL